MTRPAVRQNSFVDFIDAPFIERPIVTEAWKPRKLESLDARAGQQGGALRAPAFPPKLRRPARLDAGAREAKP
jgi:hypothetical protein